MKKLLLAILFLSCFYSVVFGAVSNYAGVYRGTINGDDYGPWMGVVEATGRTKMLFYSNIYRTMDGSQGYYVDSFGNLSAVSLSNRAAFSVSFTAGGSVYGTWASPNYASGTISGTRQINNSKYAGTYTGTISGSDSGSWTIGINNAGLISGSGYSRKVGSFNVDGAVDDSGFFMGATDQSAAFGSISGNNISGSWFDNGVIYGGTFNGIKQAAVPGLAADVEAFVTRFYQQCLGREPDAGGLDHWVDTLISGSGSGADLAWSFIFSVEFQNSGTTDEEYLNVLYRAFFDREPDQGGFNHWLSLMAGGTDRATILEGFTTAQEFITLCDNYGIQASFTNSHSP